jgi:hypothetical protein
MALEIGQNPARLTGDDSPYSLHSIVGPGVERAGGTTPISDGILGVLMIPGVRVIDDLKPDENRVFETREGSPKSVAAAKEFFREIPEGGKAALARFLSQDRTLAIRRDTAGGQGLTLRLSDLAGGKTELGTDIPSLSSEASAAETSPIPINPRPIRTSSVRPEEPVEPGGKSEPVVVGKLTGFNEVVTSLLRLG